MDLTGNITDDAVDPVSSDWLPDMDVQAPPALEKMAANVAVEISVLLHEVPSTQPQCSETPELIGLTGAPVAAELVPPSGIWLLPSRHWPQVRQGMALGYSPLPAWWPLR